jgi:hypothetical protein
VYRQRCCDKLSGSSKRVSGRCRQNVKTILGSWRQGEKTYRDELVRMFVDVPADPEHETFFREFKETLKARFAQLEIWVTSHDIRVL